MLSPLLDLGLPLVHYRRCDGAGRRDPDVGDKHKFVLITNDLSFSAILAASAGASPSVVQIRGQDLLSEWPSASSPKAIEAHRKDIDGGALLSIDEGVTRVRMLRLKDSRRPS